MAMQLRQNLNMRMEQKLKLTPQMIQSIEILLLPQMALEERIMQEIESNPVLEIADGPDDDFAPATQSETEDVGLTDTGRFEAGERERTATSFEEIAAEQDAYADFLKKRASNYDEDAPDKMAAINATAERPPVLADHLLDQLRFIEMSDEARELLADICWQLDAHGYLTVSLEELFEEHQLEHAEEAWEAVRSCEPIGVGARDLVDCLLMQLEQESGDNTFEMELIKTSMDDVLRNRLPVIAANLGVEVSRVQEGVEVIGKLDPRPGMAFALVENQYVIPDAVVERNKDGEWVVSIPDSHLPKIQVNDAYNELLDEGQCEQKDKVYLKEQMSNARFIIDAVAQRKRTLLKIATEIVKHQQAFLEQGPEHLRPLMRQDIADKIGMHVATVSRAVKDKYIQTPSGVMPLATFFSGGISSQDGTEGESSRAVRLKIAKLIENEDKRKPLSDQAIVDILVKEGLDISRRTVTKYRIADGIPSTRQRRVY